MAIIGYDVFKEMITIDTYKIGKNIALLRKARGLTQQQLAETLGVTNKAVSKWETGEGLPDISVLPALAAALQTTTDSLLSAGEAKEDEEHPIETYILQKRLASYKMHCLVAAMACVLGVLLAWVIWAETQTLYAVAVGLILQIVGLMWYEIRRISVNAELQAYNSKAEKPVDNPLPRRRFYALTVWLWSILPIWCTFSGQFYPMRLPFVFLQRILPKEFLPHLVSVVIYALFCTAFSVCLSLPWNRQKKR